MRTIIYSILKVQFNYLNRGHLWPKTSTFYSVSCLLCSYESPATSKRCNEIHVRFKHHRVCGNFVSRNICSQIFLFSVSLCSWDKIPSRHLPHWGRHTTTRHAHSPCQRLRKRRHVLIWTELAPSGWLCVIAKAFNMLLSLCRLWVQYVLNNHTAHI